MKSSSLIRLFVLIVSFALGAGAATASAQDLGAIKERMAERQAAVDALKDRGVAGETNRGFLEARGSAAAADQQVIAAENADRRAVYAAIAAQTGANAETVGRKRAEQIATLSKAGVWIQDASGEWRQKR